MLVQSQIAPPLFCPSTALVGHQIGRSCCSSVVGVNLAPICMVHFYVFFFVFDLALSLFFLHFFCMLFNLGAHWTYSRAIRRWWTHDRGSHALSWRASFRVLRCWGASVGKPCKWCPRAFPFLWKTFAPCLYSSRPKSSTKKNM